MAGIKADGALPAPGAGWGWIVGYGILSVLLGLFAFAQPLVATFTATVLVGAMFLIAGIVSLAAAWQGRGAESRGYAILFGMISIAAGLLALIYPVGGALTLTFVITAWLAARGIVELIFAVRQRFGRAWMLLMGILNLGLAIYVRALLPVSALAVPGVVLAISFLVGGVNALVAGLMHRRGAPAFALPG